MDNVCLDFIFYIKLSELYDDEVKEILSFIYLFSEFGKIYRRDFFAC